jgi:hypothetical protein
MHIDQSRSVQTGPSPADALWQLNSDAFRAKGG